MKIVRFSLFAIVFLHCMVHGREEIETQITFKHMRETLEKINDGEFGKLLDMVKEQNDNPLLLEHSHHFLNKNGKPGQIYQIGVDEYTKPYTPENLNYQAYSAVGYGLGNSIILINDEGFVLIDAGSSNEQVDEMISAFQAIGVLKEGMWLDPPLHAIIYTHNHIDHTGGGERWIERSKVPPCPASNDGIDGKYKARKKCVEIISHNLVPSAVINTSTRTGEVITPRSIYMYGIMLPLFDINVPNNGIGPPERLGNSTFHPPTKTFSNTMMLNVIDLNMQLQYVPSETNDEIIIFLPDCLNSKGRGNSIRFLSESKYKCGKIHYDTAPQELGTGFLASAEAVQGPSFPNLYSLRGTTFRNPLTCYQSIDVLRRYNAWGMVPSHGVPLMGKSNIQKLLVNFRDAIAIVHDQALRYIRQGFVPDEIVEMVEIPDYILKNLESISEGMPNDQTPTPLSPRDYLRTLYGSVPQAIRELYVGYIGWNEGDPTFFKPLPPKERSNRYVKMMGGAEAIIAEANKVYDEATKSGDKKEFQWVSEILVNVIRATTTTQQQLKEAKLLKAKAFMRLAITDETNVKVLEQDWFSLNPNWRNWFLTGALELGLVSTDEHNRFPSAGKAGLVSASIQAGNEPGSWVQHWTWRFNYTNDELDGKTYGWEMLPDSIFWGDTKQRFILQVDGNVVRYISDPIEVESMFNNVDHAVSIDRNALLELIKEDVSLKYGNDDIKINPYFFVEKFMDLINKGQIKVLKGGKDEAALFYLPGRFDATPSFYPLIVGR